MAFMRGDPMVTPGKNQQSVNTMKDMYGIFNSKPIERAKSSYHVRKVPKDDVLPVRQGSANVHSGTRN